MDQSIEFNDVTKNFNRASNNITNVLINPLLIIPHENYEFIYKQCFNLIFHNEYFHNGYFIMNIFLS